MYPLETRNVVNQTSTLNFSSCGFVSQRQILIIRDDLHISNLRPFLIGRLKYELVQHGIAQLHVFRIINFLGTVTDSFAQTAEGLKI